METTVVKGLKVLEALAVSPGMRSLTDLASQCGMTKSNAHRLLRTLEECGYVRRDAGARNYGTTLRLWEFGVRIFERLDLRSFAVPHLRELAEVTEETTHLSIFDGEGVLYLDKVDGIHAVRAYVNVGDRAPAYCSSTGKSMLAHMPEETIRRISTNLKRYTENTVTSPTQLRADLEKIRQQGFSVTSGEWRAGVLGIATAIRSPSGQIVGAIGVAGPEERMRQYDISRYSNAVLAAGARIETELGFRPSHPASEAGSAAPRKSRAKAKRAVAETAS